MTRNRLIVAMAAIWLASFVLSFVLLFTLEPTGDGFTRGINRIGAFVVWQGVAILAAAATLLLGFGIGRDAPRSRWMSRVPALVELSTLVLLAGLVLILSASNRPIDSGLPPGPATEPATAAAPGPSAPAVTPAVTSAEAAAELPAETPVSIRQFNGIFRSGFEASHFYTMDGQGPWWLEADGAVLEQLNASYVDGPGRAGGVTVALTANGWLEETAGELDYLGIDEYRFHVVSIEGIRVLSAAEFERVLEAITRNRDEPLSAP